MVIGEQVEGRRRNAPDLHYINLAGEVIGPSLEMWESGAASGPYSGAIDQELNVNGTFDRMLFNDYQRIRGIYEVKNLVEDLHREFQDSERSRLVVRILADLGCEDLRVIVVRFPDAEIDCYPDIEGRFVYLTFSENKPERVIPNSIRHAVQEEVWNKAAKTTKAIGNFEEFASFELRRMYRSGFSLEMSPTAEDLQQIWHPFGWKVQDCQQLLDNPGLDKVLALRCPNKRLVAAALYNDQSHLIDEGGGVPCRHGETTEWATLPEYRHHGLIVPLLISLHCLLIEEGVRNVWADLRAPSLGSSLPHSISPALKSGMSLFIEPQLPFLSTNHVTIFGEPDGYNRDRGRIGANIDGSRLRCFVKGFLDSAKYTDRLRDDFRKVFLEGSR